MKCHYKIHYWNRLVAYAFGNGRLKVRFQILRGGPRGSSWGPAGPWQVFVVRVALAAVTCRNVAGHALALDAFMFAGAAIRAIPLVASSSSS